MTSRALRFSAIGAVVVAALSYGAYHFVADAQAEESQTEASTETAAGGKTLKQAIDASKTYASFNGGKVTGQDVLNFINKLPPALQAAPDQLLPMIVNQLVNDQLVAIEAKKIKLADEAVTKQRISDAVEQVVRDRYVEKQLEGKVTDAKLKAKYDSVIKNAKAEDEIHASHILVEDEKTAKEIIAKLAKGEDFKALAKKYSIDPSKEQAGDLGYVTKDLMVKEFGDALFAMKKGDVSKAPVKTQFGYHVIKVEDRRQKAKPTFDQVKDSLAKQMTDDAIRDVVKGLREKSDVKLDLPNV